MLTSHLPLHRLRRCRLSHRHPLLVPRSNAHRLEMEARAREAFATFPPLFPPLPPSSPPPPPKMSTKDGPFGTAHCARALILQDQIHAPNRLILLPPVPLDYVINVVLVRTVPSVLVVMRQDRLLVFIPLIRKVVKWSSARDQVLSDVSASMSLRKKPSAEHPTWVLAAHSAVKITTKHRLAHANRVRRNREDTIDYFERLFRSCSFYFF